MMRKDVKNLLEVIVSLDTTTKASRFFRDLLTEKELVEFAARWQVAQLLNSGKTYIDIQNITGMSSRTVARIQQWIRNGRGGYKDMLKFNR